MMRCKKSMNHAGSVSERISTLPGQNEATDSVRLVSAASHARGTVRGPCAHAINLSCGTGLGAEESSCSGFEGS